MYEYGNNLVNDLKELYGENYLEVDEMRVKLFDKYTEIALRIESGRSILQNPVPIGKEELIGWLEYNKKNIENIYKLQDMITKFVEHNHMK